jgi:DNA-binding response OmpR family regulator
LVVDDEDPVREGLVWSLRLSGYQVEGAASGAQALSLLSRRAFDLMLLDMNMPAMDGVEVMMQARRRQPDLAIVVLTGHATVDSAIAAVKAGAGDYLLKPASIQHLQAAVAQALTARADRLRQQRVVALLGQAAEILQPPALETSATAATGEPATVLAAGALLLDLPKRIVTALLQELMRHPNQVRTCRQLVQAVWSYDLGEVEAAGMVRPHIARLRKKTEVDPGAPQHVKTVRGGGYFLMTE